MQNWTSERLADLIELRAGESTVLEFKSALPDFSDRGKAELLKDVSAMANASGGTILFGISEADGLASEAAGLRIEDGDALIRRVAQIVQEGIEPRLDAIEIYILSLDADDVLVVEVPQSFDGPHRFRFNNNFRFVRRYERHVADLSYQQIRVAFDRSSARLEKLNEHWRDEFENLRFWRSTAGGPSATVRLAPLISADGEQIINPNRAHEHWDKLIMRQWGGGSPSYNYYGLAAHPGGSEPLRALVQVHRSGAITAWRTLEPSFGDDKVFYGGLAVGFLREALKKQKHFLSLMGITGPCVLNFGIHVSECRMVTVDGYGFQEKHATHVDIIDAPPVWIENLEAVPEDFGDLLAAPADFVWQAFGEANCPRKLLSEPL